MEDRNTIHFDDYYFLINSDLNTRKIYIQNSDLNTWNVYTHDDFFLKDKSVVKTKIPKFKFVK